MIVQCLAHAKRVAVGREVEVDDLAERMDAGIGAAGGLCRHRLTREAEDRLFQRLLHAHPIGLALPAAEGGSVVFERQLISKAVDGRALWHLFENSKN